MLAGGFSSVSGLGMEVDYEVYAEGGSSYPRFFFKNVKPQHLVLEQGVVTTVDSVSLLMGMVNMGMSIPLRGHHPPGQLRRTQAGVDCGGRPSAKVRGSPAQQQPGQCGRQPDRADS